MAETQLKLFNTLGRERQIFAPLEADRVRLYTCGPTVYNVPHIGNLRTFVFEDVLRRTLRFCGYQVTQVMNITDVDDKIIAHAGERGLEIDCFTEPFIEAFFRDLETLGVERAEHYPRATRYVDQMVAMIAGLVDSGHAYVSDGSVFFRLASFERYGRLAHIDPEQMRRGDRVADDEYAKDDVRDFVLWKAAKPGEPSWASPWGPGRPGWHIECSAMSRALLGDTFDIHCGGVDNIFPHHENEIAQSESFTGAPFARYWLHAEHLLVDGEKMSKSLGNQYTLAELLERGVEPRVLRHLFVSVHYRQRLNFTMASVDTAAGALRRIDEMQFRLANAPTVEAADGESGLVEAAETMVGEARERLADDLNTSGALGAVFGLVKEVNRRVETGISGREKTAVRTALRRVDDVFGVLDAEPWRQRQQSPGSALTDAQVDDLLERRAAARRCRDFAEADRLRDQLVDAGIVLEDTAGGTRWRRA